MNIIFLISLLFYSKAFAIQEYCKAGYKPVSERPFELDLSSLNRAFTLYQNISTPPSIKSTITQLNICNALSVSGNEEECDDGTYVCQKIVYSRNEKEYTAEVHSIVGDFEKAKLETEFKAINTKKDSTKNGYRYSLTLTGGGQTSTVTFECDTSKSREDTPSYPTIVSYDSNILSLEWKTVFACTTENNPQKDETPNKDDDDNGRDMSKEGISVISIFFILIMVLLVVYFAGGAAYNIKMYNAKGFDLIPHRDFWLDLPYLIRDLLAHIFYSIKHNGNRSVGYTNV